MQMNNEIYELVITALLMPHAIQGVTIPREVRTKALLFLKENDVVIQTSANGIDIFFKRKDDSN